MPAIAINPDCPNPPDANILNNVLKGDFAKHLDLSDFFNVLNQLLSFRKEDALREEDMINCRIESYMESNLIKNIFDYFAQNINNNREISQHPTINALILKFCSYFLKTSKKLKNTTGDNDILEKYQEAFGNYFIFLDRLLSIPDIIDTQSDNNSNNANIISHSQKLLKDLIDNSTNTALTRANVRHFFSGLGHLVFNLGLTHDKEHHIVAKQGGYKTHIEGIAKSLYDNIESKVDTSILADAIRRYSLNLYDGNIEAAEQHCLDLFNQTCLTVDLPTTAPMENTINTVATKNNTVLNTDSLSSEALRTEALIEESTTANSYLQGNVTLSSYNNTRNGTEVDATLITSSYRMPSALELGTAAGHGIGNGVINAASQQLAEYLNRTGYSRSKIAPVINLTSTLVHSAYAAALPLMLTYMQNPDVADENTADEMWQKVIPEVIPSFVTNLAFSLVFQGLDYCQTHYLSGYPTVKAAVQTIPVVSTAYAAISAPISTAVNISAAATSSLLTKSAFHFFAPATKKKVSESIELEVEMQPLTMSDNLPKQVGEGLRKHKYITEKNLRTLRNNSETLKTALESLVTCLEKSIKGDEEKQGEIPDKEIIHYYDRKIKNKNNVLSLLRNPLEMTKQLHELLMDEKHEDAYKIYDNEQEFKEKMGTTGSLFKRMEGYYLKDTRTGGDSGNLSIILHEIKGHLDAKKEIFEEEISIHLNTTLEALTTLLSPLSNHINQYNSYEAGLKGEERGRELLNSNGATTILRKKSNEDNTANNRPRRHTVTLYSSASNSSNGSTTLSTLSASSERDPIEEQQERPLLLRP